MTPGDGVWVMEVPHDESTSFGIEEEGQNVKNDVAEDVMSVTVKLAKEINELDINQPTEEDTEERVMTSHTRMCEMSEVTSVEEGHDVERVIVAQSHELRVF